MKKLLIILIFLLPVSAGAATYGRSLISSSTSASAPIFPSTQWRNAPIWASYFTATSTATKSYFEAGIQTNGDIYIPEGAIVDLKGGDGSTGYYGSNADGNGLGIVFLTNSLENMFLSFNGNLGIGTSSPWRRLSVGKGSSDLGSNALAGSFTATSTTATSTFAGDVKIDGYFNVGEDASTLYPIIENYIADFMKTVDGYAALSVINPSDGIYASADFIVNNASTTETSFYGDFGMASPNYADPDFAIFDPNDVYLFSHDSNLILGVSTSTLDGKSIKFFIGDTADVNSEKAELTATGFNVTGNGTYSRGLTIGSNEGLSIGTTGTLADDQNTAGAMWLTTNAGDFSILPGYGGGTNFNFNIKDISLNTLFTVEGSTGNVGIGTAPSARLHLLSTTEQQRTGYDASNYYSSTVGSTGGVTFNAVGSGASFGFSDNTSITGDLAISGAVKIGGSITSAPFRLRSSGAGIGRITNVAENDFTRLQFGQTGSTYPALQISNSSSANGNSIQIIAADGAADANLLVTGNAGIGTTTPWGKLSVTNTGANPSFIVEDSTSPDSTPFIVDTSGNVGIGKVTPATKLQVFDTTAVTSFTGLQTQGVRINGGSDGVGSQYALLGFGSGDSVGSYQVNMAQIGAYFTNVGYAQGASYLQFGTTNNKSSGITNIAMTINPDGNVGIGTTSPYAKLSVDGEVVAPYYTATSTTATSTFATGLRINGVNSPFALAEIYNGKDPNNTTLDALTLSPGASGNRVNIGTVRKPAYSLNVSNVTNGIEGLTNLSASGYIGAGSATLYLTNSTGNVANINSYYGNFFRTNMGSGITTTSAGHLYGAGANAYGMAVQSSRTDSVTLAIGKQTSQTADLTQWLTSSSNKVASVDINGRFSMGTTTSPKTGLTVQGDIYSATSTPNSSGIILTSPNGTCHKLTVSDADVVSSATVICPN